jgi:hypothetical protein
MAISYPAGLPPPLVSGFGLQHVSPMTRTPLTSGRARQRREYTSVPSDVRGAVFLLSNKQCMLFEAWFKEVLIDGTEYFDCPMRLPTGRATYKSRFTNIYAGPDLVSPNLWRITAPLEIEERPLFMEGWAEFYPEFILQLDLWDFTLNQEWPAIVTGLNDIDLALNELWPEA